MMWQWGRIVTLLVSLPFCSSADCKVSEATRSSRNSETSETSLFQSFHDRVPTSAIEAAAASNKENICRGQDRCFDLPALRGLSRYTRTVFHQCSSIVRSFETILEIFCDYSSETKTLPLNLVTLNNFTGTLIQESLKAAGAIGSGDVYTNYMPILSPDFLKAETFIPFAIQERASPSVPT